MIINRLLELDPLAKLVQKPNFVGWVYSIDYDTALVITNDLWKQAAMGVPHNCFLLAATFDPQNFVAASEVDREAILLRVVGSAPLPQHAAIVQTKVDYFQRQPAVFPTDSSADYDDLTRNQIQFGGLECRVLGTFYTRDGALQLGSDLESFSNAARLNVFRPRGDALTTIVNYVDPLRKQVAAEEARALGIDKPLEPFTIGTVRYTSTDRLHRQHGEPKSPVAIQPSDFLARRTAVLGMTRTGKSNLVKQLVRVVKRVSLDGGMPIGQLIYDINGEYANANQQDQGAIADVYPKDTVRYRMLEADGFQTLKNNFYTQLQVGFATVRQQLAEHSAAGSGYVQTFRAMSFDEPPESERSDHNRWEVRTAAYQVLLHKAQFEPPKKFRVQFEANVDVRKAVDEEADRIFPNPKDGLTLQEADEWFRHLRSTNRKRNDTRLKDKPGAPKPLTSSSGSLWVDEPLSLLLDMIAQQTGSGTFMQGYQILAPIARLHSPARETDVADEIADLLRDGKIVVLDLSVGDASLRDFISRQVITAVFERSMRTFVDGGTPPNVVVYIEEAHNLIGRRLELTEIWPRVAKEGAKYRLALVYATQEPSSVHPNILANTENWFVTHLNNEREIKELAGFYDFGDFARSLSRAQDVGFARVKSLSGPFVIPVQLDKFDPDAAMGDLTGPV